MISPKDAVKNVLKTYPNRSPLAIFDYDDEHYIVSAPLKNLEKDRNGTFFGVNKITGVVTDFAPGSDYVKFFDAIDNKGINL